MEITYENLDVLARGISYTDHVYHFEALFSAIKPKTFLEWGCGLSTKIFLENCEKVISVEIMTLGTSDEWFLQCLEMFGKEVHWQPVLYKTSGELLEACGYQSSIHKDYALVGLPGDDSYVFELDSYIKDLMKFNEITVSFVDAGVCIRGDMVELSLQNGIPIVIAHDTANSYPDYPVLTERKVDTGLYGWFKIQDHLDYEKIFLDHGQGTTFWIRKDLPHVIDRMKLYKQEYRF